MEYVDDWLQRFDEARSSLQTRENATAELVKELEVDVTLLGATGVEDALQVGVGVGVRILSPVWEYC